MALDYRKVKGYIYKQAQAFINQDGASKEGLREKEYYANEVWKEFSEIGAGISYQDVVDVVESIFTGMKLSRADTPKDFLIKLIQFDMYEDARKMLEDPEKYDIPKFKENNYNHFLEELQVFLDIKLDKFENMGFTKPQMIRNIVNIMNKKISDIGRYEFISKENVKSRKINIKTKNKS